MHRSALCTVAVTSHPVEKCVSLPVTMERRPSGGSMQPVTRGTHQVPVLTFASGS